MTMTAETTSEVSASPSVPDFAEALKDMDKSIDIRRAEYYDAKAFEERTAAQKIILAAIPEGQKTTAANWAALDATLAQDDTARKIVLAHATEDQKALLPLSVDKEAEIPPPIKWTPPGQDSGARHARARRHGQGVCH